MNNKSFFLLMRGFGMFLREFKINLFSLLTLCTLIFVYHIICTTGTGLAGFLAHIAQVTTVRAYLDHDTKDYENIVKNLEKIENVSSVKFYSSKDAKEFVIENAPNIAGMKSFADDFFPSFVELMPNNPSDEEVLKDIEKKASEVDGVDVVSYGKEFMTRFLVVSRGGWIFMIVVSGLFSIAVAFTIFNTVKLSLYKFREEIKLYSLVGATRPFISVPYIFSSLLQIVLAYIISSILFIFVFNIFNSHILQNVGINIFYLPNAIYFIVVFFCISFISVLSAAIGVVSFLKQVSSVNED